MKQSISFFDVLRSSGPFSIKAPKTIDHLTGGLIALLCPSRISAARPDMITSVLVIRPGGIGDAVLLLPVLRSLKKTHPLCKITILCQRRNADIFHSQEDLCEQVLCADRSSDVIPLLNRSFDLIVDTEQWHYSNALLTRWLKCRWSVGFNTRPLRKKLFHDTVEYSLTEYETNNFAKLARPWIKDEKEPLTLKGSFHISPTLRNWAASVINDNSIVIAIGAGLPERQLSAATFIHLTQELIHQGASIILLGSVHDCPLANMIKAVVQSENLQDFVGKTSLMQSAALIERSKLFIGMDSGMLHIAAALNKKTIAFFGPGNHLKWAPQGPKDTLIRQDLACSPCTHFSYTLPTCRGQFPCMRTLNIDNILSEISSCLKP